MSKNELLDNLFGKDTTDQIKNNSPFRNYKTWKLVIKSINLGLINS